jgi:hypothetical protein
MRYNNFIRFGICWYYPYEISISKTIISIPTAMIIMLMRFSFAEHLGVHLTNKNQLIS